VTNDEDPADAAARLESALERIAELARRRPPTLATREVAISGESVDTAAIAGRLDTLIARLRGVLDS
jgi:hypothetical protein